MKLSPFQEILHEMEKKDVHVDQLKYSVWLLRQTTCIGRSFELECESKDLPRCTWAELVLRDQL